MGNGYAASHSYILDKKALVAKVPLEYEGFLKALEEEEISFDDFCREWYGGDTVFGISADAYSILSTAFEKATTHGQYKMQLDLIYYSSEDGDRYDDIAEDGGYFCVFGSRIASPAAEGIEEYISLQQWVVFG